MKYALLILLALGLLGAHSSIEGKEKTKEGEKAGNPPKEKPHYRLGKAPKGEFKAAGKTYKINPEASSTKQIRAVPSEYFDPASRRERVETFYRTVLKERYDECCHLPPHHCGPFRWEFVYWTHHWPVAWRARWAWHHHLYIDEPLWMQWMADRAFAAEIASLQRQNAPVAIGYLPPEYSNTSPVLVYTDEYLNAVYNPIPFLAVLKVQSLKPDAKTDWIGTATTESLITKLSSIPGLFIADSEQVTGALKDPTLQGPDVANPKPAAQVGKVLDVERVIAGSYVVDGDRVLINLRIVDVQTGAVQNGISQTLPKDHLLDAMPGLGSSLAAALGYPSQDDPTGSPVAESESKPTKQPSEIAPSRPVRPDGSKVAAITLENPGTEAHLAELQVGASRTHKEGKGGITNVGDDLKGWQFTAVPGKRLVNYKIKANRDCVVYAFGGKGMSSQEMFGNDWRLWEAKSSDIQGKYIAFVFRRSLRAGETVAIQGNAMSIAAQSIQLK